MPRSKVFRSNSTKGKINFSLIRSQMILQGKGWQRYTGMHAHTHTHMHARTHTHAHTHTHTPCHLIPMCLHYSPTWREEQPTQALVTAAGQQAKVPVAADRPRHHLVQQLWNVFHSHTQDQRLPSPFSKSHQYTRKQNTPLPPPQDEHLRSVLVMTALAAPTANTVRLCGVQQHLRCVDFT